MRGLAWMLAMVACSSGADAQDTTAASIGEASSSSGATATGRTASTTSTTGQSGSSSVGGSSSSSGPAGDTASSSGTTGTFEDVPWVLTIDEGAAIARLMRVDLDTGLGSELCMLPAGRNYNSLAFSRDGVLYAHSVIDTAIDRIDPCTCADTRIGSMLGSNLQLTADEANGLFGITLVDDMFVRINPTTAAVTPVGPLGVDFEGSGIAWSDALSGVWALRASTDELYRIDPAVGAAMGPIQLPADFGTVGLDYHPVRQVLYGCSNDTELVTIDPVAQTVTAVGPIGGGTCDNLAAPWGPIACVER